MKKHPLTQNQTANTKLATVAESQLFEVSGGLRARLSESVPVVAPTPKEPVYITLAIGEGGGKLPDILS
ncbi:MAG: hypothetical protein VYE21_10385 [Pseudomonadota bacterium]|nr:hypothetical protein [Pseudomonadota bacterium]